MSCSSLGALRRCSLQRAISGASSLCTAPVTLTVWGCFTGISLLWDNSRRASECTPPEEFHLPRLCTEELQWKTFAQWFLGLLPALSFVFICRMSPLFLWLSLYCVFCQSDWYGVIRLCTLPAVCQCMESCLFPYSPGWTVTVHNLCLRFLTAVGFMCSQPSSPHGECQVFHRSVVLGCTGFCDMPLRMMQWLGTGMCQQLKHKLT